MPPMMIGPMTTRIGPTDDGVNSTPGSISAGGGAAALADAGIAAACAMSRVNVARACGSLVSHSTSLDAASFSYASATASSDCWIASAISICVCVKPPSAAAAAAQPGTTG
jgi:hypothetical protein